MLNPKKNFSEKNDNINIDDMDKLLFKIIPKHTRTPDNIKRVIKKTIDNIFDLSNNNINNDNNGNNNNNNSTTNNKTS